MFFTLCRSPSPKGSISWGFLGVNGYSCRSTALCCARGEIIDPVGIQACASLSTGTSVNESVLASGPFTRRASPFLHRGEPLGVARDEVQQFGDSGQVPVRARRPLVPHVRAERGDLGVHVLPRPHPFEELADRERVTQVVHGRQRALAPPQCASDLAERLVDVLILDPRYHASRSGRKPPRAAPDDEHLAWPHSDPEPPRPTGAAGSPSRIVPCLVARGESRMRDRHRTGRARALRRRAAPWRRGARRASCRSTVAGPPWA